MARNANFQVDPRLAVLLGETYRSSEQAIKELVDNAWDAEAEYVWITLPAAVTLDPVVIRDDGSGMIEREIRQDYLKIARDRRITKGERTPTKQRLVKGRKGIGKFAGLMVADHMEIDTMARGKRTRLAISKDDLANLAADLEKCPLPLDVQSCDQKIHGTEIRLTQLHQHHTFPDPERLKQLLVLEYGRALDFVITVNGTVLSLEDVPGTRCAEDVDLPNLGTARLRFTITDDLRPKQSGIVVRVAGKIIGKPSYFGLDTVDDIPPKLLRRVYGEVEADGLLPDITADNAAFVENSTAYRALVDFVQEQVRAQLQKTFTNEMNLAKARVQQEINRRLANMPEYRREFAYLALERIMQRFYDQPEDRLRPIVSVVLDALERDEYWQILQRVDAASHGDVGVLAEALREFGILELALIARQARH